MDVVVVYVVMDVVVSAVVVNFCRCCCCCCCGLFVVLLFSAASAAACVCLFCFTKIWDYFNEKYVCVLLVITIADFCYVICTDLSILTLNKI